MKKEYQDMINKYVDRYNNADSKESKKRAALDLELTKIVIDAFLFSSKEMEKLS